MHLLPASFLIPREAGLLHFGVRSAYVGTANWLNFVPLTRRCFSEAGVKAVKIEFFCGVDRTRELVL